MRRGVTILLLLAAGLLAGTIGGRSQDPKREPAADRDDCPRGDCCLWRVGMETKGRLEHKLGKPHECPAGQTAFGTGFLELDPLKSDGPPCDEKHGLIPDGSKLNAAIHTVHRKDDLAHICGTFTISYQDRPIFTGDIDLMHRVNTHHDPFGKDPCDRKDHLQGWLLGKGAAESKAQGYLLRAMLVARTDPRDGGVAGYAIGRANLDGVILRCEQGK